MKTCKYPDKRCKDRYEAHPKGRYVIRCRLDEWKQKIGVCPYDKTIHSQNIKRKDKEQQILK